MNQAFRTSSSLALLAATTLLIASCNQIIGVRDLYPDECAGPPGPQRPSRCLAPECATGACVGDAATSPETGSEALLDAATRIDAESGLADSGVTVTQPPNTIGCRDQTCMPNEQRCCASKSASVCNPYGTACPDTGDFAGICDIDTCGATEQCCLAQNKIGSPNVPYVSSCRPKSESCVVWGFFMSAWPLCRPGGAACGSGKTCTPAGSGVPASFYICK
jgi:hypothetical protein